MRTVEVQEAKTHLSALPAEVERGATIAIARGPRTIAHLVPADSGERELGFGGGRLGGGVSDCLLDTHALMWAINEPSRLGGRLEWDHRDPFDRVLAAQVILESLVLITVDPVFAGLPGLRTLW